MLKYSHIHQTTINIFILLTLLLGSMLRATPVYAASITVNTTTDENNTGTSCSLREAIAAANANTAYGGCSAGSGADVITLPAGTYTLTIPGGNEDLNATGDLDITSDLTINGAGAGGTIIQAGTIGYPNSSPNGIDRVIEILGANTVSISDVTIANGNCLLPDMLCHGGGIHIENTSSTVTITDSNFSGNDADQGGGIHNHGDLIIINNIFSSNRASLPLNGHGGGIVNRSSGTLNITNSTFSGNVAAGVGGAIHLNDALTISGSTFVGNTAESRGGGISIYNGGTHSISNSTFSGNTAVNDGGGIYNFNGTLSVINSTFSGNGAIIGGGINNDTNGILHLKNTLLANSVNGVDCYNGSGDTIATNTNNLIETNGSSGNMCGTPALSADPNLGTLSGSPAYFRLNTGSPAIDAGNNNVCSAAPVSNTSQNGVTRPQGSQCDIGSYEYVADASISVSIGDNSMGSYAVTPGSHMLQSYPGTSGGPVFVDSTNNAQSVSSLRLLYNNKTFSELMGVSTSSLSNDYWLPYYRNVPGTDTQIRFTNTDDTLSTTVNVYLGNNPTPVYTNTLLPETADRFNLPSGTTGGPVHIVGTGGVNILAGMRVIYGGNKSFDELMAFPTAQLDTEYWFPFYNHNNVNLDTEIRVANTSSTNSAPVQIYIGDTLMDTTTIAPLDVYLREFAGVSGGPVRVVSTSGTPVPVVTSLRLLYNNKTFSELMGVPTSQLSNDYWLPYYANIPGTDTQIRFTNTSDTLSTTVNVYLGNNPTPVYTSTLLPETADRFNLPSGTTGGPVHIVGTSGVNILAGMRVIYGGNSSFDELMAYPDALLSAEYWFPFYNHNNVNLNTELRIGVP